MSNFYAKVGNFAAVAWCSLCVAILGLIMMVAGAIITGIAYTEITPPNYDENYNRYIGSSVPRIMGESHFYSSSSFFVFFLLFYCFRFFDVFWNGSHLTCSIT